LYASPACQNFVGNRGPRPSQRLCLARPRQKPASNPASISQYPQCSKRQNFQTIGQITPQINSKKSLQAQNQKRTNSRIWSFNFHPFSGGNPPAPTTLTSKSRPRRSARLVFRHRRRAVSSALHLPALALPVAVRSSLCQGQRQRRWGMHSRRQPRGRRSHFLWSGNVCRPRHDQLHDRPVRAQQRAHRLGRLRPGLLDRHS
jgi:hypothetical protein